MDPDKLKTQVRDAFSDVEFPGDWCLRGSNEGDEPFLLEQEFQGKSDWRALDAEFLDQAPGEYSTALCFFSDEAFRFYLPAYITADIDGHLKSVDVVSHLTHGFTDAGKLEKVNPRRYGERTWFESASHKMAVFNRKQAVAIVAYLKFKREKEDYWQESIDQALTNFWVSRADGVK